VNKICIKNPVCLLFPKLRRTTIKIWACYVASEGKSTFGIGGRGSKPPDISLFNVFQETHPLNPPPCVFREGGNKERGAGAPLKHPGGDVYIITLTFLYIRI
jgi:hypothetical protein